MMEREPDARSLQVGDAHIYVVRAEGPMDPGVRAECWEWMDGHERARHDRFRVEHARDQHILARALVRTVLSRYVPVDPGAWRFTATDKGRPEIAGPEDVPPLRFNLSHTRGLLACVVTLESDAGIDVEWIHRKGRTVDVADRYFSPIEVKALHRLPVRAQRDRFFDLWTLKEAYIKARGLGLALPLRKFSMHVDEDRSVSITMDPSIGDVPEGWYFQLFDPTDTHRLAVGIRGGHAAKVRFRELDVAADLAARRQ